MRKLYEKYVVIGQGKVPQPVFGRRLNKERIPS
jgi:hypothetical protein